MHAMTPRQKEEFLQKKRDHLDLNANERESYHARRDEARLHPQNYLSVIIDSASTLNVIQHFPLPKGNWPTNHLLKVGFPGTL